MQQALWRSWRIGQTQPVQVIFMAYRNTLQADALKLVAKKLQSSLAVEGELPEDGLATYGHDGDDLRLALARKIVAGEEDADSVESVFARAQQVGADAETVLVDNRWSMPGRVAPEVVAGGATRTNPEPASRRGARDGISERGGLDRHIERGKPAPLCGALSFVSLESCAMAM